LCLFACADSGDSKFNPDPYVPGDEDDSGDEDEFNPTDGDEDDVCSGYGYGGECPSNDGLDCDDDPCVFGSCVKKNGEGVCECWDGYTGETCATCAVGYVVQGLRCVKEDICGNFNCLYGTCIEINGQPVCDCYDGYSGTLCDECADGYVPENLRCVPKN